MRHFDLVVIGSGPGGQKAAIQAAKLGKTVAVIEKMQFVGGVAINTGTIPSKALREAVMSLVGVRQQHIGEFTALDRKSRLSKLVESCQRVIRAEIDVVRSHFGSNGIELLNGIGSFVQKDVIVVEGEHSVETVGARKVLIAVGTTPTRPENIRFDSDKIITSDELLNLPYLPSTMIIVGGGVIGTEYASMLAALGVRVTLIEGRSRILDFLDAEIGEALQYHLRQMGMTLRLGEKVVSIKRIPTAQRNGQAEPANALGTGLGVANPTVSSDLVEATLESGKTIRADCLLYCVGRQGATSRLNLNATEGAGEPGVTADDRGRIKVNEHYQTGNPDIYAVGDVIGFPALASTSMEQGRMAACHMFGEKFESYAELFPYGIYSIPEISMVGWTEEKLTQAGIPYEAGIAQYKETARGQLLGDERGMLKLLIHQESGAVLGVHIIGSQATELVHIGQAVMAFKGTVDYFVNTVFNYPTLAECYKIAAFNGRNKIRAM
ncbi:MAG TPA: NAD(P)(+) transhydrogenase (Si-specific) [Phycisphaerales bacterium]|nr:NAD(P)(+) transhydrogenase (Si-specific) [Phycisphaerales bacterium]